MVDEGDKAPDFELESDEGGTIRLSDLQGSPVVVYFYPKDDTSGCTKEAIAFTELAPEFAELGVRVIGVSPDTVKSHQKFKTKHNLNVELAADTEKSAAQAYGVWVSKSMYGRQYMGVERSTFLVGKDGRLNQGPMSLSSLVPVMEDAINREMADLEVKIDDAIIQRAKEGPGVNFRLRNIRLIDNQGAVVAQAPLAAIGLSGRALLSGRIAPGSVDFIGPRLLLFHTDEGGLSLSFSRADTASAVPPPAGGAGQTPAQPGPDASGTSAAVRPGMPIVGSGKEINITRTVTAAFDQARKRKTASSFLTRFGVRDAVVVFDREGTQSFWQVPDFANPFSGTAGNELRPNLFQRFQRHRADVAGELDVR